MLIWKSAVSHLLGACLSRLDWKAEKLSEKGTQSLEENATSLIEE